MDKLSIVHINTHDVAGGAAKVAWRLAEAQRKNGHDAKMLVGIKMSNSEHSFSFPIEPDPSIQQKCHQNGQLFYEFQGSHKLINHPLVQSADILHLHNLHGGYFNPFSISALSHLKPVVWTLHDMQSFTGHCAHSFDCDRWQSGCGDCPYLQTQPVLAVDTSAQLLNDKKLIYEHSYLWIVTPSQWLKNKVEQSILQNHHISLIHNGIDTSVFKPFDKKEARRKFGIPEDLLVIGAVSHGGTLDNEWKGGSYTQAALEVLLAKLPNCVFVNIGTGNKSENPRIISIPHITRESELAEAYSILDMFLYTPAADNCPLVVLEALSCGVPIVTFPTGGVPELVRHGTDGLVTEHKNVPQIVQATLSLASNPELLKQYSQNAHERAVSTFDHEIIAHQYQKVYERCMNEYKRKPTLSRLFPLSQIPPVIITQAFQEAENSKKHQHIEKESDLEVDNYLVSSYWSQVDCSASEKNFYCFPPIRSRACKLIFNEFYATQRDWCEYWTVDKFLKDRIPFNKALSLCCGFGAIERRLAKMHVARKIVGIDIAAGAIKEAQKKADEENLADIIEYYVSDINNDILQEEEYDLIWANGALHHIKDLNYVIPMLYKTLKNDGFLISNEYVGPKYQQIGKRQQELVNFARNLLPKTLKNTNSTIWQPLPVDHFLKNDPSECINSDKIIPILADIFDEIEVKYFGGSILFYALDEVFYNNFDLNKSEHKKLLETLFRLEDSFIELGEIPSDNAHIICKKINKEYSGSICRHKYSYGNKFFKGPLANDQRIVDDTNLSPHNNYDVSIIVATKNRAKLLDEMLTSLEKAAEGVSYEVIVVEGGSSDNTLEILRKHSINQIYNETKHLGEGKHSWPQLYNFGFSKAKGKWAMFASDDISFQKSCITNAVEILDKQSLKIAGGIFFYKNIVAEPGWEIFGIDYTFGNKLLMNYGLVRLTDFREVNGFDEKYHFYCADGDLCLKLYERNKEIIHLSNCLVVHNNLLDCRKKSNLDTSKQDIDLYIKSWGHFVPTFIKEPRRLLWHDIVESDKSYEVVESLKTNTPTHNLQESAKPATGYLETLQQARLWAHGQPLRLHLGCGGIHLKGYVNFDYPPSEHTSQTMVGADIFADITTLDFPHESVDEIRLHHVFEHFDRPTALALLCRWNQWLKIGGILTIETPDFSASISLIQSPDYSYQQKQVVIRHVFGSHEAKWAIHYDGWYEEKFRHILESLGFGDLHFEFHKWKMTCNITVHAKKLSRIHLKDLQSAASNLLLNSLVDDSDIETRLLQVWQQNLASQLHKVSVGPQFSPFVPSDDKLKERLTNISILTDSDHLDNTGYDNSNRQTNGELRLLQRIIKPDDIVFDIGAHQGAWSREVLSIAELEKLYAFEPIPQIFTELQNNLSSYLNLFLINCAISSRNGTRTFYWYAGDSSISEMSNLYQRKEVEENLNIHIIPIEVQTQTLDSFCDENAITHIDFLKIDTEGAELEVLQGASRLLKENRICYLQFEYGGTYSDAGITLKEVCKLLTKFSYRVFRIIPDGLVHISYWRDSLENYRYSNYLAVAPWASGHWSSLNAEKISSKQASIVNIHHAKTPIISIFMPVFNGEIYLAETLDSLLSQTFGNFEIIIADDGSTDRTLEIAKTYELLDKRIKVLSLPHRGEVVIRNEAIKHTNPGSKYLLNHDSDDISLPTKLEKLVQYLETHPEIAIVGCFAEYFNDEGNIRGIPQIEWEPEKIRETFGEVNSMINSASLIRREVFGKIGDYREEYRSVDDYDFFARALLAGFQLANIPEVLHKIRIHSKSIGSTKAKIQETLAQKIREKYKEQFKSVNKSAIQKEHNKGRQLKLHLGCGNIKVTGFINVDIDPTLPSVDVVDNVKELNKFSCNSASIIYACHILEHFPNHEILPILRRWYEVLEPGGELRISVPDIDRIVKIYYKNWEHFQTPPNTPWIGLIYGGQEDEYDFHKTGFNCIYLKSLLEQAGFDEIEEYPHSPHWLGIQDASLANEPFKEYISLNLKAKKPHLSLRIEKTKKISLSILHTVEFYPPHVGGAEIVVQQISERLAKRGHRVEVATTKLPDRSFKDLNGVSIHEFDITGNLGSGFRGTDIQRYIDFLLHHPAHVVMNYAAQQWATDLAFATLESTREKRVTVIAPCGYSALDDARTVRWPQFTDYFNKIIPMAVPIYDAAVYHSSLYKDYEFANLHGFQNSVVIPNGVDEEEFTKPLLINFREKYKIVTPYMGLCVANFYAGKGHERVIEAVRQMNRPDFTMVFIGKEGNELQPLKKQSDGLNIKFVVNIPREDTVAAYHTADVFLFGSHIEASPLVIIEAKASKTPFVSTDCGNVGEWKGGIVCLPDEMANEANNILDNASLRKQLSEEGYIEWKEKLTWEAVVDKYEELYLRLYNRKAVDSKKVEYNAEQEEYRIKKELEKNFKNTAALLRLAELELKRSEHIRAQKYCLAVLALEPQNTTALTLLEKARNPF